MKKNIYIIGVAILIMVTLFSTQVFGQFKDKGVRVGLAGGLLGGLTKATGNSLDIAVRLFARHNIVDNLDGDFAATIGQVKGDVYQCDLYLAEYKALYKPYVFDKWEPYAGAGLGLASYTPNPKTRSYAYSKDGITLFIPFVLGTEYSIDDKWNLDANVNFSYAFTNEMVSTRYPSNLGMGTGNDAWWGIFVGASYTIMEGGNKAAELEAIRVRNEELAAAEARRVAEAKAAEAKRVQEAAAAEAKRVQEAAAAEAKRAQEAAEAQRIQDSIKAAAAKVVVPKKEVVVPKPEPPKPAALKAEVGKAIVLEGVVFQSGKAVISPESEQILSSALTTLTENPELAVEIRGFTDNVGNAKKNLQLSQSRAEAIKAWLVKKGISSNRITAKGYGDKNPIGDNKTADGRTKNRRIEFFRTK
jgi:outer membrane protein OmpA-like peptidoglycan-associated protein